MKYDKTNSGWNIAAKYRVILLSVTAIAVICGIFCIQPAEKVEASAPTGGTINPVAGTMLTWTGNAAGAPAAANGEASCSDGTAAATNCDSYTLNVSGTQVAWASLRIVVRYTWVSPSTDYDMYVRKETNGVPGLQGDGLTVNTPPLDTILTTSTTGPSTSEEVVITPVNNGVGDFYVRAVYFAPNPGDQYVATATVQGGSPTPPPSTSALSTFDNYQPPVNLPGTATPYTRRDGASEPSIGVNWNTGNIMTMARLTANRVTFNDSTSPANPVENTGHKWLAIPMPLVRTGLDPIGYTDPVTGRSLFGELSGNFTNGIVSDDDYATFQSLPTQGINPTAAVDHQTIAGGLPNPTIPGRQPTTAYPHLVYYASQNVAYATASTSLDGGLTFLPATDMYTLLQCSGIHGHMRVAPDGTAYVPNKGCGGKTGMVVSQDNGLTWTLRTIPTSTTGATDPSIGVGAGGRVFLSYASADNHPHVVVSDDKGANWRNDFDLSTSVVGATAPLTAIVFPQAIAGDNNRAAVFFLGTTSTSLNNPHGTDGVDAQGADPGGAADDFFGTWYPYMATTIDGGATWSVVRADNDPLFPGVSNPVQQGVICTNGTTCPTGTRNLADFNEIAVDNRGRVVAVYADGCNAGHSCMGVVDGNRLTNQATARTTVIRQRGGPRLFAAFDPGGPAAPSLSPPVDVVTEKYSKTVKWAEPDDGGSPLTSYRIYRGIAGGMEQMIAEVKPGSYVYRDRLRKRGFANYYYRVTAVNAYGESPPTVSSGQ